MKEAANIAFIAIGLLALTTIIGLIVREFPQIVRAIAGPTPRDRRDSIAAVLICATLIALAAAIVTYA